MAQSAYSLAVSQGRSGTGLQGAPGTPGGPTSDWRGSGPLAGRGGTVQSQNPGFSPYGINGPPQAGGWIPPAQVVVTPNPGDFDQYGNRWEPVTGQWLPPNFFSDLNPQPLEEGPRWYGGGGGGGGPAVPAVGPGSTDTGASGTITPRVPGNYTTLDVPESLFGYVPAQYRTQAAAASDAFLRGMGYVGTGALGRYGETAYIPPAESVSPFYFAPALFDAVGDPTLRSWIRYLYGGAGYGAAAPKPE